MRAPAVAGHGRRAAAGTVQGKCCDAESSEPPSGGAEGVPEEGAGGPRHGHEAGRHREGDVWMSLLSLWNDSITGNNKLDNRKLSWFSGFNKIGLRCKLL